MEWYRTVRTRPWTKAVAYVTAFYGLLAVAMTAMFAPALFAAQTYFLSHVGTVLPETATFEVADGRFSTNLPEPFEAGSKEFRVTVDTSVVGSELPSAYAKHDGVLIGRDAVIIQKSEIERRSYLMSEFPDFTIVKGDILRWGGTWGTMLIFAAVLMFAVAYFLLGLLGSGLYVALTAALAAMVGSLWGVKIRYASWFAVGLHAVTLPTLVNLASNAFGVRIPFAYTFIHFMFLFSVIADERAQPTAYPPAPSSPVPPPAAPVEPPARAPEPPPVPPRPRTRKIAAKPPEKPAARRPSRKKPAPKQ